MSVHATSTNRSAIVIMDFDQNPRSANEKSKEEIKAQIKEKTDALADGTGLLVGTALKATTTLLIVQGTNAAATALKAKIEALNPELSPAANLAIDTGKGFVAGYVGTTISPMIDRSTERSTDISKTVMDTLAGASVDAGSRSLDLCGRSLSIFGQ